MGIKAYTVYGKRITVNGKRAKGELATEWEQNGKRNRAEGRLARLKPVSVREQSTRNRIPYSFPI